MCDMVALKLRASGSLEADYTYTKFKPDNNDAESSDDDMSWLYGNDISQEIAAAPEAEGYLPEGNDQEQTPVIQEDDDGELPF